MILKTKEKQNKGRRPQISFAQDWDNEKPCGRNNAEVICVLAFRGRVRGGLDPMVGKCSYPFHLVFNSLFFFLIS